MRLSTRWVGVQRWSNMAVTNFLAPCSLALLALVFRANLFCPPEINFTYHGDYSNALPSARVTFFWPKLLACWLRRPTKRTTILDGDYGPSALFLNILLLCGDISLNPGPGIKHPCAVCSKPVKVNQRAVQCDYCDRWHHARCCEISDAVYDALTNSSRISCGSAAFDIRVEAQHGFRPGRSCETQLINTVEHLAQSVNDRNQTDLFDLSLF